ncbi:MAG: Site-specific integrase/recombinase [Methanothrix harundinacea]|uniref:Site-specific integrase/recombinase n=1 Tax=Methanothrix harundinacea TaxID=301375 RepID=A0A101FS93_9EURY|nr:MAG: Site-specific integrase/recombinase [Methanothrix harundinacea]
MALGCTYWSFQETKIMKRLDVKWGRPFDAEDLNPALRKFRHYIKDRGLRDATIDSYVGYVRRYLEFTKNDKPSCDDFAKFRRALLEKDLSRSSINNYCFAIRRYHEMLGGSIEFPFMRKNDEIPYYFGEDDVLSIFSAAAGNIKHLAMLQTLFYGCLRASELCNLDDGDLDLRGLNLRVREGKGGRDGIVPISNECATTLRRYLQVRPPLEVDGKHPLFYTDYGKRWDRKDLYRMFVTYKEKACVEKNGAVHVFSRHTPATIMIANGCDIRVVKEVLRHRDIRTTLRYAHVADKTMRGMYDQHLKL